MESKTINHSQVGGGASAVSSTRMHLSNAHIGKTKRQKKFVKLLRKPEKSLVTFLLYTYILGFNHLNHVFTFLLKL